MNSFTLPSFAKINLLLRVIGKRPDDYHEICTVFQTISLCDEITFSPGESVELSCSDRRIPVNGKNLIIKAANLLREEAGSSYGARIFLRKRIPSPGGLGGGSSNAAVALIGLARLWDVDLGTDRLKEIASELGSDVPFFLQGGTAFGTGRGTEIEPIPDISGPYILIVTPNKHISTRKAFARLNAESLTIEGHKSILLVCRLRAESLDLSNSTLENDMEPAIFGDYPEIARVKARLLEAGASNALMSGSGASVFAVFDKEETRQTALKALGNESNWRKFAVAAITRDEYRAKLGLVD